MRNFFFFCFCLEVRQNDRTSAVWHTYSYFPCTDFIFILAIVNQFCRLAVCEINKASTDSVSLPSFSSLGILTRTRHRQGSSEIFFVLINGRPFTDDVSPIENRDGCAISLSILQFDILYESSVFRITFFEMLNTTLFQTLETFHGLFTFNFHSLNLFLFITAQKLWNVIFWFVLPFLMGLHSNTQHCLGIMK